MAHRCMQAMVCGLGRGRGRGMRCFGEGGAWGVGGGHSEVGSWQVFRGEYIKTSH